MTMQRNKNYSWLAVLLFITAAGCKEKTSGRFEVVVNYKNAAALQQTATKILLEEIPYGSNGAPQIIDSATINQNNGTVRLAATAKDEGVYQVVIENGPFFVLINDVEKITVDLDISKRDNYYTVSGSPDSKQLQDFIKKYGDKVNGINESLLELDSLKKLGAADSLLLVTTNKKNKNINLLNDFVKNSIEDAGGPALSMFMLGLGSSTMIPAELEKMLNSLLKKYPEYKALVQLKTNLDIQKAQMAEIQKRKPASTIGQPVPELSLPDINGKPVSVSSFRGKYVLIDFWASWCGPCRMENPNVVAAYKKYKDKNFTILGVSLDKEKDAWQKAIKDDELTWTHISDLAYWNSIAVKTFGFDGIPYNVLVDPQGRIIAESLRGAELEAKLGEVLK